MMDFSHIELVENNMFIHYFNIMIFTTVEKKYVITTN